MFKGSQTFPFLPTGEKSSSLIDNDG